MPRAEVPVPPSPLPQLVAKLDAAPAPGPPPPSVAAVRTARCAAAAAGDAEIEALFANFVDAYERGRLDAFAALFDEDADTNLRRGRAAIRGEYDELFRLSQWRRMQLTRVGWRRVGRPRRLPSGEITVKIGWRDGREVEQRVEVDMELVRRDGRVVIARLVPSAEESVIGSQRMPALRISRNAGLAILDRRRARHRVAHRRQRVRRIRRRRQPGSGSRRRLRSKCSARRPMAGAPRAQSDRLPGARDPRA